jgi:hypothetical protein
LKGEGKLHLRIPPDSEVEAIRKAATKTVVEYPLIGGKYHHVDNEVFDDKKWWKDILDVSITGWDDLFDKNEKPIPVTAENKVLLMNKVLEVIEAYATGMGILRKTKAEKIKAAEKN